MLASVGSRITHSGKSAATPWTHTALWRPLCEELGLLPAAMCMCVLVVLFIFCILGCFDIFKILLTRERLPFSEGANS